MSKRDTVLLVADQKMEISELLRNMQIGKVKRLVTGVFINGLQGIIKNQQPANLAEKRI